MGLSVSAGVLDVREKGYGSELTAADPPHLRRCYLVPVVLAKGEGPTKWLPLPLWGVVTLRSCHTAHYPPGNLGLSPGLLRGSPAGVKRLDVVNPDVAVLLRYLARCAVSVLSLIHISEPTRLDVI
eukprot:540002-Prorocentrum_lima.AAC.1